MGAFFETTDGKAPRRANAAFFGMGPRNLAALDAVVEEHIASGARGTVIDVVCPRRQWEALKAARPAAFRTPGCRIVHSGGGPDGWPFGLLLGADADGNLVREPVFVDDPAYMDLPLPMVARRGAGGPAAALRDLTERTDEREGG